MAGATGIRRAAQQAGGMEVDSPRRLVWKGLQRPQGCLVHLLGRQGAVEVAEA